jgi:hypothetical protein
MIYFKAVKKIALENGFKFGFGGSHFWVADAKTVKRLILVPFE